MPAPIKGKQIDADTITGTNIEETGTISTVNAGDSAVGGSSTGIARRDHQHAVATGGSTTTIQPDDSAAEGTSSNLAREDHAHAIVAAAPSNGIGAGNSEGSSTSFARADHDHTIRESGAQDLTLGAISDGQLVERSGTTLAGTTAIDDTQHGNRGGGTLHSNATTGTAGFMSSTDKAKLDTLQDASGMDAKESCRAKTTTNITLSGEQTIDGVSIVDGDRVLVDQQTTASQDGIYVASTGAWSRSTDAASGSNCRGWICHIEEGTTYGDQLWQCTNNKGSDVVNTDGMTWAQIGSGSPRGAGAGLVLNGNDLDVGANVDGSIVVNADDIQVGVITEAQHGNLALNDGLQHAVCTTSFNGYMSSSDKTKLDGITAGAEPNLTENAEELTTENITGTDTALTDTLSNTPDDVTKVAAYLNGVKQLYGAGNDFTVSGTTLTWLASTGTAVDMETTDTLEVVYLS